MSLSCNNLSKSFNRQEILKSVSLKIGKGELISLRGPSGCGKTTLLKCLALLSGWDNGSITINDNCISHVDSKNDSTRNKYLQHANISVVFQQLYLWPHLTCKANVELAATKNFDWDVIKTLGLTNYLSKYPSEISLGQAQRVAYTRAIASQPEYLLLDEVTSALDHDNTKLMADLINSEKTKGMGILVITHSDEFENLLAIDNKYEMHEGRLNEHQR